MKNAQQRTNSLLLTLALSTSLLGCGGGASDAGLAGSIDNYFGTIVEGCFRNSDVKYFGASLYTQRTWSSPFKVSSTKMTYTLTQRAFVASDCSGAALSTVMSAPDNAYFEVVGSKSIGSQTVDQINYGPGFFFLGLGGATIKVDGVTYSGWYTNATPSVVPDIGLWQGKAFYSGDRTALDAQGYPTALRPTPTATIS